ncbi:MAG TPA: hypothetical protein VNY07_00330 [Chthoniobacterales bacterium]|jgi:hypothetical protein|nr:hypothetical protein [Chthoniobacterales bacterium]
MRKNVGFFVSSVYLGSGRRGDQVNAPRIHELQMNSVRFFQAVAIGAEATPFFKLATERSRILLERREIATPETLGITLTVFLRLSIRLVLIRSINSPSTIGSQLSTILPISTVKPARTAGE